VWVLITYVVIVGWFGVLFAFPDWAMNISPMGHIPVLSVEEIARTQ
jgi:ABC-2 type transport system permease protein